MKIVKFNISKPKKYTDKNNEEKTQWNNIGTITEFHKDDGTISRIMEIPTIGLEANIFPFVDKTAQAPQNATTGQIEGNNDVLDDNINP